MATELIVSALPGEIRAAVLKDGNLDDLLILRDNQPVEFGDRFLARVRRFDKGLDGAFVDLGLERDGLLPRREAPDGIPPEGTALPVFVKRAPSADKGARVSAKAVDVEPSELEGVKAPARLMGGKRRLETMLHLARPQRVVVDDVELLRELKATEQETDFALHSDAQPLFETAGVEAQLEALLAPRIDLPDGGFLLIEPVRTLTAIDVNAGRSDARGGQAAQAKAVNLAAVPAIARQLRLRALSGLIVIDFLAMKAPADRTAVAAALREAVADGMPCQVFGMSPSGLLEMTRRRDHLPLHELLCRPCGLGGSGRVKTPETLAYEALRHTTSQALGKVVTTITLRAAPAVAAALETEAAAALAAVEGRLGRGIAVEADPLVPAYKLVLG